MPSQMYHRLINEEEPEDHYHYHQNDQNTYELKNRSKERSGNSSHNPNRTTDWSVDHNELNNKVEFIYHTIKPNETLQGIALRYSCTVSKLRLYNHLMTDNEFYGLSVIKIPVLKNGVLKEQFDQQNQQQQTPDPSQFVNDLVDVSDQNSSSTVAPPKTQVINIGISNYLNNNGSENYSKFFQILSDDFKEIRQSILKMENSNTRSGDESQLDPGTSEANVQWPGIHNATNSAPSSGAFMSCDGSDFGIHWRYLILILVIICFLVPSFVLFTLEHHNNSTDSPHHHTNGTGHWNHTM